MKIVEPRYQILEEPHLGKKIEKIARLCYKSEDKITENSYKDMIRGLVGRQHYAMLEHADMCLEMSEDVYNFLKFDIDTITTLNSMASEKEVVHNYLRLNQPIMDKAQVCGNIRAWYEYAIQATKRTFYDYTVIAECIDRTLQTDTLFTDYYKQMTKDLILNNLPASVKKSFHSVDIVQYPNTNDTLTVRFTTDRGITHELVRHRTASFAQESTRYCNYSKGKFGEEISVVLPYFLKDKTEQDNPLYQKWVKAMENAEKSYFVLLAEGAKPQDARDVLPTSTKADIFVTATLDEWVHIFELRACDKTGPAHPQIKEIMCPLLFELQHDPRYCEVFANLEMSEETLKNFVPASQKENLMER